MSRARSGWPAKTERWLLALLVVHAAVQCAGAGPADPGREDANKKAQSPSHNSKNSLPINAVAEQSNGQTNESQSNKNHSELESPKQSESHKSQPEGNDVPGATQGGSKTENKASGGPKAGAKSPDNKKDKKADNEPKDELKKVCNETSDCAPYNGTACVADSDGQRRCLCGNRKLPRNSTFCKDIRRYAKFPCSKDSQCIANAACKLVPTYTNPHVAHTPDSTALICWCVDGFNFTKDHSQCLDPLSLYKEEEREKFNTFQTELKTLQEKQKKSEMRLQKLENSGHYLLPSLTITILTAASMLVVH
ncbi:hypothetical protein R5R35_009820 [Gryllus longicercus]|uniref:EGF-like domain-containing protein n=1 Tax=Gryllus longicercus TaxID=2509291 RepID=A0AAN9VPB5_9ORTH